MWRWRRYVLYRVFCMYVCMYVTNFFQNITGPNCMKISGMICHHPRTNQLNIGSDQVKGLGQGHEKVKNYWTELHEIFRDDMSSSKVMDSGMRAYIPYSLITFSPSKPWFDRACSSAISDREGAHRSYQASPSELTHAAFISARNCCSAKLRRAPSSFRKRKIDKLNSSPTEKCFWSLS